MLLSKKKSSSLRYLKARFAPFVRPLFWGSAGILALFFFGLWEYSQHPEWLRGSSEQPDIAAASSQSSNNTPIANSELSVEELAGLAEVDNLNSLFEEAKLNEKLIPNALPATKSNNKSNQPKTLLDQLTQNQQEKNNQNSSVIPTNPQNQSSPSQFLAKPDPVSYLPTLKDLRSRQRSSENNPLQQALKQANQPTSIYNNNVAQNQNSTNNTPEINQRSSVTTPQTNQQNNYLPNYGAGVNNYNSSTSGSLQGNPYNYVNQPQYYNNVPANPPTNNSYFQSVYPQYANPSGVNNGFNSTQRNTATPNNQVPQTPINQPTYNGYGYGVQSNPAPQAPTYQPNYNNYGFQQNQTPPTQRNQNQQNTSGSNYLYYY